MLEEEWGFFIDLELHPSPIQKETKKEIQEKIQKKTKVIKPFGKNCLSIIYEDELWYKRDEEDDNDYKCKTWECSEEIKKKEKILVNSGCIDKTSAVVYCLICASLISLSFLA
jgi:hypothetical protein